jgi:hypothetical protein
MPNFDLQQNETEKKDLLLLFNVLVFNCKFCYKNTIQVLYVIAA